jgi:hypothetical protein
MQYCFATPPLAVVCQTGQATIELDWHQYQGEFVHPELHYYQGCHQSDREVTMFLKVQGDRKQLEMEFFG